jgi:hypothetical protein
MKEDGRLNFGQVPALAVTTGGKTTIINQRWVGRVRVVCVCVCGAAAYIHLKWGRSLDVDELTHSGFVENRCAHLSLQKPYGPDH